MKVLDYYYLVLLRGFNKLDYKVPGIMAFTLVLNLFSLVILFTFNRIESIYLGIGSILAVIVINAILQVVYNKKRKERIKEKYKGESRKSRQRGVVKVVIYEVLSLIFLICVISTIAKSHP